VEWRELDWSRWNTNLAQLERKFGMYARIECAALVSRGAFAMHIVPVWLPPLPLAIVALALFCLGILAWLRGSGRQ